MDDQRDPDRNPDQPAQSQEQPDQDSQLRTPQADQPIPPESERAQDATPTPAPVTEPGGSEPQESQVREVREVREESVRQESDSSE